MAKRTSVRDIRKEALWRRRLRAQVASGLSIRVYSRRHRLPEQVFYWWRGELVRRDTKSPVAFVPVTVMSEMPVPLGVGRIEILMPGGLRVGVMGPVVDRKTLSDVLAVLGGFHEVRPGPGRSGHAEVAGAKLPIPLFMR